MTIRDVTCRAALGRCGIPTMDWCVNPYVGCAHACVYCYASFMKRFTGHPEPWGAFVDVRVNVADVLARQLRRARTGRVMLSSVTDAWQPIEQDRRVTRACLEALSGSGLAVSALTKSAGVLRDLDLLASFGGLLGDARAEVGFTITTLSDELAAVLEPGASPPSRRLAALRDLSAAGIRTWVFVAPVIPGLTDSDADLRALAREARRCGADEVAVDPLNFYPAAVHTLAAVVACHRPAALPAWREAAANPAAWRDRVPARL